MNSLEEPHIQELLRLFSVDDTSESNHSVITWTVNRLLESKVKPVSLQSTIVCLGKHCGTCFLSAFVFFNQDLISLEIIMKIPKGGFMNFRFGFKSSNETKWFDEFTHEVKFDCKLGITYNNLSNYFDANTNTIVILCELFVTTKVPKLDYSVIPFLDRTEYAICVDFYHLLETGYLSDLTLLIGEIEFDVHSSILSAKSGVFKKMIEEMDEQEDTLELVGIPPETMSSMLLYIYTGNIEVWSKFHIPTISLWECVNRFEIVNMKTFLEPFTINLTQNHLIKEFEFEWEVECFSELHKSDLSSKTSPLFQIIYGSFYLNISYVSSDNLFFVTLEPSKLRDNFNMTIEITISHSESDESKSFELQAHFQVETANVFEIASFTKEDLRINSTFTQSTRDALTMSGKCLITNYSSVVDYFSYRTTDEPLIEEFSSFKTLLENGHFSDLKFIAEGRVFPAHKSILGARLPCFKELFEIDKRIKEISMDEIGASAMESFLLYLYTGKIDNEIENLLSLLPLWDKYGNNVFGAMLFNLLTQNINSKNVCNILSKLYSLRKAEFFDSLKSVAMNFLCGSFFEIESSESWDKFVIEKNEIARIVLTILSGAYRKHSTNDVCIVRL